MLDELLECRDDVSRQRVMATLQEIVERESAGFPDSSFIDRYNRKDASLHIHGTWNFGSGKLFRFCAMIERTAKEVNFPFVVEYGVPPNMFPSDQIQVSMSVDVRQLMKPPEMSSARPISSIVRLHALDELKCSLRNTGKRFGEIIVGQRSVLRDGRIARHGDFWQQREATPSLPSEGQTDSTGIQLDEIENQVIQNGSQLIEKFPDRNRQLFKCAFVLRLRDNYVRLSAGVTPPSR